METVKFDPAHIAGYGQLADETGDHAFKIGIFVSDQATSDDGFSGLMTFLRDPVDEYAQRTMRRFFDHKGDLSGTGAELTRSAWVYSGAEEANYVELDVIGPGGERMTRYKDFPGPIPYPPAVDPLGALQPPQQAEVSLQAQLEEVGGLIKGIDDAVSDLTGWSPVEAIVDPMSGSWPSLQRAGEALRLAGTAAEQAAGNLTGALGALDATWDGGAAQTFTDYITRLAAALEEEGPLNRIAAEVYGILAALIEEVAGWMVLKLNDAANRIAQAAATWWIPFFGWFRVGQVVWDAIQIFQEAKARVEEIEAAIDQAKAVIEALQDPIGTAKGKIEETLAPLIETAETIEHTVQVGADAIDVSDTSEFENAPEGEYELGDPGRPGA